MEANELKEIEENLDTRAARIELAAQVTFPDNLEKKQIAMGRALLAHVKELRELVDGMVCERPFI